MPAPHLTNKNSCGVTPPHNSGWNKPVGSQALWIFNGSERRRRSRDGACMQRTGTARGLSMASQPSSSGELARAGGGMVTRPRPMGRAQAKEVSSGDATTSSTPQGFTRRQAWTISLLWPYGGSRDCGESRPRKTGSAPHVRQRRSCCGTGRGGGRCRGGRLSVARALLEEAARSVLMCGSILRRLGLRKP